MGRTRIKLPPGKERYHPNLLVLKLLIYTIINIHSDTLVPPGGHTSPWILGQPLKTIYQIQSPCKVTLNSGNGELITFFLMVAKVP